MVDLSNRARLLGFRKGSLKLDCEKFSSGWLTSFECLAKCWLKHWKHLKCSLIPFVQTAGCYRRFSGFGRAVAHVVDWFHQRWLLSKFSRHLNTEVHGKSFVKKTFVLESWRGGWRPTDSMATLKFWLRSSFRPLGCDPPRYFLSSLALLCRSACSLWVPI